MAAAAPVASIVLLYRIKKGKEHAVRLPERRGETKVPRPPGRMIWLHGASVGEINAAMR
jgi:3-deoxy-D-manno-octulosonic-acid transferase